MTLTEFTASLNTPSIESLLDGVVSGKNLSCSGIAGSLKAVLLSKLFERAKRTLLCVVNESAQMDKLEADLKTLMGERSVFLFPAYDTVPYEKRRPHSLVVEERLRTFDALFSGKPGVVVADLRALLLKTIPPAYFRQQTLDIKVGEELDREMLLQWLLDRGFESIPMIDGVGQYSVRGGIVDVFPYMTDYPVRMEFFGDTVESLRLFDVFTQRSLERVPSVRLIPMREIVKLTEDEMTLGKETGPEWRLPQHVSGAAPFFRHLPGDAVILWDETGDLALRRRDLLEFLSASPHDATDPAPEELLIGEADLAEAGSTYLGVSINTFRADGDLYFDSQPQPPFLKKGAGFFDEFKTMAGNGFKIIVACENAGQEKRFQELAIENGAPVESVLGNLEEGFILNNEKIAVLSENLLFNRYANRLRFRKFKGGTTLHHVSSLKVGDYVVHEDHGIGRFLGLERVQLGRLEKDCIRIEYAEKAMLSVPVEDLNRVQKYMSGEEGGKPELSALGGKAWNRAKSKTKEELNRVVRGLVELYAQRHYFDGSAFPVDSPWQKEFEDSFIYEDTPDQKRSAEEVKADLMSTKPMDRLVCGDAGFGKTEVAMRAAFKVVESGQQVAVLAPTTLLVYQHFHSFSERFRDYPFRIGMVSRFMSKKENEATVQRLKEGGIDIIIGTHRLLSKDVQFKDIGLLVIDEEHKFGVKHKERIKEMKAELDVMTMTATPIPRTLQFSLLGVRDMSLINTPPRNRIPIETRIVEEDRFVLREAILREKARGGQIYYVHNRVETIDHAAEKIHAAVPGVTLAVAHGQMDEKELEEVMVRFLERGTDILVCSAIIESGLDIPNVNTIIVADADRFGLSQLYQLRGRVGRSSLQAYAYLMVRAFAELTDDARRRLKAMEQLTDAGSGYRVAMRDLEIRGAGNLLGVKQHGLLCTVGFEMYNAFLQEAVLEIRENRKVTRTNPAIRIEAKAFIPAEYITETAQRLEIYHRLSRVAAFPEFEDLAVELKDRYGPLPEAVIALIAVIAIKFVAGRIQASAVTVKTGMLEIQFAETPEISPADLGRILKELPPATRVGYEKPLCLYAPLPGKNPLEEAKNLLRPLL